MNHQDVEGSASGTSGFSYKHWLSLEQLALWGVSKANPAPTGMGLEKGTDVTPQESQSIHSQIREMVAQASTQPPNP